MARSRLLPVLAALGRMADDEAATWSTVCTVCAEVLAVGGASITLMPGLGDLSNATTLGVSDEIAGALEDAQFTLGEGPYVEAVRDQHPVGAFDLLTEPATAWTAFTERAVELGVRAVTATVFARAASLGA